MNSSWRLFSRAILEYPETPRSEETWARLSGCTRAVASCSKSTIFRSEGLLPGDETLSQTRWVYWRGLSDALQQGTGTAKWEGHWNKEEVLKDELSGAWRRSRRWWPSKKEKLSPYAYAWRIVTSQFYEKHCLGLGKPKPCPYYYNVRSEEEVMMRMICRNRTYNAIFNDRNKTSKLEVLEKLQRELDQAYTCPSKSREIETSNIR